MSSARYIHLPVAVPGLEVMLPVMSLPVAPVSSMHTCADPSPSNTRNSGAAKLTTTSAWMLDRRAFHIHAGANTKVVSALNTAVGQPGKDTQSIP